MSDAVTIGITSYNASQTILKAIESALAQNYPHFKIIIVDDCSNDGTWELIQSHANKYSDKIVFFRNYKNLGVASTRNRIIAEAKGEFLAFFDDDDMSDVSRIQKQVTRIKKYEENFADGAYVICHTARMQEYPDGKRIIAPTMGQDSSRKAPSGEDMAGRILYNKKIDGGDGAMPTCSQMARTSTYKVMNGFDPEFRRMEDTEFNLRLALAGGHFVGIEEPLVIQAMTQADDKQISKERMFAQKLYKKHRLFLEKEGRGQFDLDWLEAKHDYWEGLRVCFALRLFKLFVIHPLLSFERFVHALPNTAYNKSVRDFHRDSK